MMLQVIVYILYSFVLYTTYSFGLATLMQHRERILSTAFMLRFLFFIKTSVQLASTYLYGQPLDVMQTLIYSVDTLLIFIFTKLVFETVDMKNKSVKRIE